MAKAGRPRKCDQQKKTDIKLIDMSRIEIGDVIQTWSDDRDFLILSQVNGVGKIDGKIYIDVDEHNNKCFLKDVFAHYVLVIK